MYNLAFQEHIVKDYNQSEKSRKSLQQNHSIL